MPFLFADESPHLVELQVSAGKIAHLGSSSIAQPCPTRTPRRMIVSRWTPVMRSIERMLEPSANAPITAICLSVLSTFAMLVTVLHKLGLVNSFCVTIFWAYGSHSFSVCGYGYNSCSHYDNSQQHQCCLNK